MSHKGIELILTRQLAGYLATPIFIVDPEGDLIYYNEPAEAILGRRFDETGELPASEWATALAATDEQGNPIPLNALPLSEALAGAPSHQSFWIKAYDGTRRRLNVFALPLLGHDRVNLGAVAVFWEAP